MKKATGLVFVLFVIAMAVVFSSAASAVPASPPNDNQCICHETQHNNKHADGSQKGVIICVDPNSISRSAHIKHGDPCVLPINPAESAVAACADAPAPVTAEACTGAPACALTDDPFDPACCVELNINPSGDISQCEGNQACVDACIPQG